MTAIKKIHKWASLIVGLQVLIWLGSGFYFNLMDHTKAKGTQYRISNVQPVNIEIERLIEPEALLKKQSEQSKNDQNKSTITIVSITLSQLLSQPIYVINQNRALYPHFLNEYTLVDAYSGKEVIIDAEKAEKLASASYKGPGEVINVSFLENGNDDFPKEQNATWRVNYDDELNTSIYIEVGSGRLVGHSNDDKRFADFFFMLHFMDYGMEGNFNSVQIILFAFITLWLTLTGFIWTIELALNGQYQFTLFSKNRAVKLLNKKQQPLGEVILNAHTNLLDGLTENNINIPSVCGGGGTCGSCRILLSPAAPINQAEREKLSVSQLKKGYRLSCQQFLAGNKTITLVN
ncbi:2Fe-2S iron-sulfur cluster-binding protein [Colwellia sp. 1_MG-2023]|uniref:2Fe-2S iron-sulfur cluster-binding protein n=1 Tax=Colwellia sp. 1_MG-2023 TaxID=3062649 RepID=UPI0026E1260D|nr:2Fe-2S iron-sulfur cluster-binding protein [Colwellia sp. 1_MG-2023]MDO6446271.1 2Fe-2S iron-sulfur cluster-binding protein [Colwellia sp. 1_MG-2023]